MTARVELTREQAEELKEAGAEVVVAFSIDYAPDLEAIKEGFYSPSGIRMTPKYYVEVGL